MAVTRKFLRHLTGDDFPWGIEVNDPMDILAFLSWPSDWLGKQLKDCVLVEDFIIKIEPAVVAPPTGDLFYITGNSGTNIVMIYVDPGAFPRYIEFLRSLTGERFNWPLPDRYPRPEAAKVKRLIASLLTATPPVVHLDSLVVMEAGARDGRCVSHFSISKSTSPTQRLLDVAGHILKMLNQGNYLHSIFNHNNTPAQHTINYRTPSGVITNPPVPWPNFDRFTSPGQISIEYVGNEKSTFQACEMLMALYLNGDITAEQAFIKSYAKVPAPPEFP